MQDNKLNESKVTGMNLFRALMTRLRYLSCGVNSPEYFIGSVK
jgi:hypothetical protein